MDNNKKAAKPIVINEAEGLVFSSEEELYNHFLPQIKKLEEEFFEARYPSADIPEEDFVKYEAHLTSCLEMPDEIWTDSEALSPLEIRIYIKAFEDEEAENGFCFHVALCYLTSGTPSFVYLHFPTQDEDLVEHYRRGQLIFDRASLNIPPGAIEGDALAEGDELATGLYKAMLMVRSDKDLPEEEFKNFAHLREEALEGADEIWRNADGSGTILVTFIRDFSEEEPGNELFYLVVTLEDVPSNSHALLFSFPTRDSSLVERYRHGENLQAEEVVQEASH